MLCIFVISFNTLQFLLFICYVLWFRYFSSKVWISFLWSVQHIDRTWDRDYGEGNKFDKIMVGAKQLQLHKTNTWTTLGKTKTKTKNKNKKTKKNKTSIKWKIVSSLAKWSKLFNFLRHWSMNCNNKRGGADCYLKKFHLLTWLTP